MGGTHSDTSDQKAGSSIAELPTQKIKGSHFRGLQTNPIVGSDIAKCYRGQTVPLTPKPKVLSRPRWHLTVWQPTDHLIAMSDQELARLPPRGPLTSRSLLSPFPARSDVCALQRLERPGSRGDTSPRAVGLAERSCAESSRRDWRSNVGLAMDTSKKVH
jgi:hypothetical protein